MIRDRNSTIERLRKLLARAASDNVHEAAIAAERASEFMLAQKLTVAELDATADAISHTDVVGSKVTSWRIMLAQTVADHGFCRAVIFPARLRHKTRTRKFTRARLQIYGTTDDVACVMELYGYLGTAIERICREKARFTDLAYRHAFRIGAVQTIAARLAAGRQKAEAGMADATTALVRQAEAKVVEHLQRRFPKMQRAYTIRVSERLGLIDGQKAAQQIALPNDNQLKLKEADRKLEPRR